MLLDALGKDHTCLVARFHDFAITAEAKIVMIDRPDEWPDDRFGGWFEMDLQAQEEDSAKYIIALCEYLMEIPANTFDIETIKPALRAFASGMRLGLLYQPAAALIGGTGPN